MLQKIFISIIICLVLISCERNVPSNKPTEGGVIPDDPKQVEKIQLIVSANSVMAKGKPTGNNDDDGDGVLNKHDRCPEYGTDPYGCPVEQPPKPDTVIVPPISTTDVWLQCPPVMKQGNAECVAFAESYSLTIERFYKTGIMQMFSPEFLYDRIKFFNRCDGGSSMEAGLRFLRDTGNVFNSIMPYSDWSVCDYEMTPELFNEAAKYRITNFVKMYTTDRAIMRWQVDNKHPIIITLLFDNSFINAKSGFIWRTYSGSGSLSHCVTIVGYDDSKNAWKIMNSFGTEWGDGGYGWIDYDFLLTRTGTYCYSIN